MSKPIYQLLIVFTLVILSSCGKNLTFEEQIKQDITEKIASGFCVSDEIAKSAEIKNIIIGEITPIGDTGMIDVALEFDVVNTDGTEKHITDAMLYLENGSENKKLAIFCDYDYRNKK